MLIGADLGEGLRAARCLGPRGGMIAAVLALALLGAASCASPAQPWRHGVIPALR